MDSVAIIGLSGGLITTFAGVPQIIQMIKTEKTHDLNWIMIFSWFIGLSLTLTYGIMINQIPIIITVSLSLLSTTTMIIIKIYYEIIKDKKEIIEYEQL